MKKRYQITLTKEAADELKAILDELRLPPATFSNILDGALIHALPGFKRLIERIKAGEQMTFAQVAEEFQKSLPKEDL